jgi:hypothetical protein
MEEISPECDVIEAKEFFFESEEAKKTSPRAFALRISCAALVSAVTPFHNSSFSLKPASMGQ